MTWRTAFGLVSLGVLLGACGKSSDASSPDLALEAALARAYHAARCEQLTAAIAALPPGPTRDRAAELDLGEITPELAARWVPVWKRAALAAKLSAEDSARTLSGNAVLIDGPAALDKVADEAFECGSEVDVPPHD
ncbi:MAG: hypothetical protein ABI810_06110 [Sphingomonas bacterium]